MDERFIITRFTDDANRWTLEDTEFGVLYEYVGADLNPVNILTEKEGFFDGKKGHQRMVNLGVDAIQFIIKNHEKIFRLAEMEEDDINDYPQMATELN